MWEGSVCGGGVCVVWEVSVCMCVCGGGCMLCGSECVCGACGEVCVVCKVSVCLCGESCLHAVCGVTYCALLHRKVRRRRRRSVDDAGMISPRQPQLLMSAQRRKIKRWKSSESPSVTVSTHLRQSPWKPHLPITPPTHYTLAHTLLEVHGDYCRSTSMHVHSDRAHPMCRYVQEDILQPDDPNYRQFHKIFEAFRLSDTPKEEGNTVSDLVAKAAEASKRLAAQHKYRIPAEDDEEEEEVWSHTHTTCSCTHAAFTYCHASTPPHTQKEPVVMTKKKLRKLNRLTVAQLKQLVDRPDVVEMHDVTALDPKLLIHLKVSPSFGPSPLSSYSLSCIMFSACTHTHTHTHTYTHTHTLTEH